MVDGCRFSLLYSKVIGLVTVTGWEEMAAQLVVNNVPIADAIEKIPGLLWGGQDYELGKEVGTVLSLLLNFKF
jgi:hypothetical protein